MEKSKARSSGHQTSWSLVKLGAMMPYRSNPFGTQGSLKRTRVAWLGESQQQACCQVWALRGSLRAGSGMLESWFAWLHQRCKQGWWAARITLACERRILSEIVPQSIEPQLVHASRATWLRADRAGLTGTGREGERLKESRQLPLVALRPQVGCWTLSTALLCEFLCRGVLAWSEEAAVVDFGGDLVCWLIHCCHVLSPWSGLARPHPLDDSALGNSAPSCWDGLQIR